MFVLHCNKCFRRHKLDPTLVFHVSRCGHIVCATCLQQTCPVCSKPFNGAIISKKMPQGMSDYFDDPLRIYQHFQKVTRFQYDQEKLLANHLSSFNDQAEQKLKHKLTGYKKIQQKLQTKLDEERHLIRKYREHIAQHDKDGGQPGKMALPITASSNVSFPARRSMSEPPAGKPMEKVLVRNRERIAHFERPRQQSSYMKPPILTQTRPRYEAPKYMSNPAAECNPYHSKSLERTPYIIPITTGLRPRYPLRKSISDPINKQSSSSAIKFEPQLIRSFRRDSNTHDDRLGKRPGADVLTIEVQRNKSRRLSPILSAEDHKKVKPNVAWDSIKSI